MLLKCCTQYASKFGKLSSGHRTGKCQFLFQSQRKAMPKNVQTDTQLQSFHMQASLCSKSFKLGFNKCFPGVGSGKEPVCQCKRHKRHQFDPWVGKIVWRRNWQPTPVVLPGKSHGQRSVVGYSPWGRKELDTTEPRHFH